MAASPIDAAPFGGKLALGRRARLDRAPSTRSSALFLDGSDSLSHGPSLAILLVMELATPYGAKDSRTVGGLSRLPSYLRLGYRSNLRVNLPATSVSLRKNSFHVERNFFQLAIYNQHYGFGFLTYLVAPFGPGGPLSARLYRFTA
jgi:hypothetical protein